MCEGPGHEATMMLSLIPRPLLTKPLCGRGLDTSHVSKVRVRCFLRREKQNTLRMRKQCVPGPLPALWEGRGYKARHAAVHTLEGQFRHSTVQEAVGRQSRSSAVHALTTQEQELSRKLTNALV